ncbi:hypothetical protein [Brevibacillus halotolerans]
MYRFPVAEYLAEQTES